MTQVTASPGVATAEFPPPVPSRTPQLLRRLQVVVALAVLIAGAVSVWVISDLRNDLAAAPNLAQQYARLGQVQHSLTRAADLAARSVVAGQNPQGSAAVAANKEVATANGLLIAAAKDRPQDADALTTLSRGLLDYSVNIHAAAGASRATALPLLADAADQLDHLTSQIDTLQKQLSTEAQARPWSQGSPAALLVALAVIAGIGWVSWVLAHRSHRVLNVGLVAAAVAVLVVLGMTTAAQGAASAASDTSRNVQFTHVVNATAAVTELDTAQHVLTTAVLTQAWTTSSGSAYSKAFDAASAAADRESLAGLKTFDQAKTSLATQMTKGDWTAASTSLLSGDAKGLNEAADAFRDRADAVVSSATATAADEPQSARSGLILQLVIAIVLAVAGAALGVIGIDRRLREYR
nr:hypothetical protein [Propionicimonas sp.]